jgi:hypothetical protein
MALLVKLTAVRALPNAFRAARVATAFKTRDAPTMLHSKKQFILLKQRLIENSALAAMF